MVLVAVSLKFFCFVWFPFTKIWWGSCFVLVFILVCWRIYTRQYNQINLSTASLSWFVCSVSVSLVRASFTYLVGVLFELRVYLHRQPRVSMYFPYMCQHNLSKFVRSMSVQRKRKPTSAWHRTRWMRFIAIHTNSFHSKVQFVKRNSNCCQFKFLSFILNQLRNKRMPQTCTWYFISSDFQWKDFFFFLTVTIFSEEWILNRS